MKIFAGSTSQTKWRTVTQLRGQPPSATLLLSSAWHSSRLLGDKYDNPGKWKKILAVLHRRREGRAQRPTGEFSKKAKKFFCHARKRTEEAADIRPLLFSRAERWRTRPLRWAEFRASRKLGTIRNSAHMLSGSGDGAYAMQGAGPTRKTFHENTERTIAARGVPLGMAVVDMRLLLQLRPLPIAHQPPRGRTQLHSLTPPLPPPPPLSPEGTRRNPEKPFATVSAASAVRTSGAPVPPLAGLATVPTASASPLAFEAADAAAGRSEGGAG